MPPTRVLVFHAYHAAAESLAMVLEIGGYNTDFVSTALLTLERLPQFLPDVIVIDDRIPGTARQELATRIRATGGFQFVHLVGIIPVDDVYEREQLLRDGFEKSLTRIR